MRAALHPATRTLLGLCLGVGLLVGVAACGTTAHSKPIVLPTGTTLSVTLTTDARVYKVAQPIGVTVHNTSATAYFMTDGHSACTTVQLQQLVSAVWQNVLPCDTGQQPQLLQLAPHSSQPFTLAPGNAPGNPNAWAPGVYRVALTLSQRSDLSGQTLQVYSDGIQVAAPAQ